MSPQLSPALFGHAVEVLEFFFSFPNEFLKAVTSFWTNQSPTLSLSLHRHARLHTDIWQGKSLPYKDRREY